MSNRITDKVSSPHDKHNDVYMTKNLANYSTPSEPYNRERSRFPYLCGDLFTNNLGDELTLIQVLEGVALCVLLKGDGTFSRVRFNNFNDIFAKGYVLNHEFVQKELEIAHLGIYAPRKLKDGTWAGLTRLIHTTAICVDFDEQQMYESRYCFSHSEVMYHWQLATYWLAQFKSRESLPIGNCAYRGHLGTEPILSKAKTENYYMGLNAFRNNPTVNGMDFNEYVNNVTVNLIRETKINKQIGIHANIS